MHFEWELNELIGIWATTNVPSQPEIKGVGCIFIIKSVFINHESNFDMQIIMISFTLSHDEFMYN